VTILEELTAYAHDCIDGKIISCRKHKQACARFLRDLSRTGWKYEWVEEEARRIVTWFTYLRHSKGVLAGKPIDLTISQKFFICQLYGWREKGTGYKRFVSAFKMVARKNAKSQEQAGCLLYELAVESTKFGEMYETYCAGVKSDQSKLIFNECRYMLKGSPLARKFRVTRAEIRHIKSDSFLKALSKEDGRNGDGTNPAVLVLDEYHLHQTTEFYDLGLGGNAAQSLIIIITTAGKDLNSPCYTQEYKFVTSLLDPDVDIENDRYLADVYEADEGDDWTAAETWIKANPVRMSYPEGVQKISEAFELAKVMPEKKTAFLTKLLDVWVQARAGGYMVMSKWKACETGRLPFDIKGAPVYVGFDVSAKIDLTSIAFVIPLQAPKEDNPKRVVYIVFHHSFIPNREKLQERIHTDRAPYDLWEEQGYITVTDTPIVDQRRMVAYMNEFVSGWGLKIECLCFDPANASKMEIELSDEGHTVEEVFQSHRSLNESTAGFREQVYEGNVVYLADPVLNFAMANAVVKQSNGLIKIDKDATTRRIDPVDAVLAAFKLALYHEFSSFDTDEWLDEKW
jgi:phage terminase large subunit-like protein